MVFPSVPVYLDPPNWPQHPGSCGGGDENPHLPPPMPPPPPPVRGGGDGGTGSSIRPGSMTDRARLAKLPMPEAALKCPRCESTNTKFCYFNNYSLSQPRHFCRTCRRYWTRGGTLRNVPVGGGCRRNNKRGKRSSRSKSPVTQVNSSNIGCTTNNMVVHFPPPPPPPPQLPFLPSLQHLGFAFEGADVEFQMGNNSSSGGRFTENWRLQQLQQFPLLEPPPGIYQFEGEGVESLNYQFGSKPYDSGVTHDQLDGVKMEENQRLNLSRNFLGTNNQYWGGNAWTDLNAPISSSSTANQHLL